MPLSDTFCMLHLLHLRLLLRKQGSLFCAQHVLHSFLYRFGIAIIRPMIIQKKNCRICWQLCSFSYCKVLENPSYRSVPNGKFSRVDPRLSQAMPRLSALHCCVRHLSHFGDVHTKKRFKCCCKTKRYAKEAALPQWPKFQPWRQPSFGFPNWVPPPVFGRLMPASSNEEAT